MFVCCCCCCRYFDNSHGTSYNSMVDFFLNFDFLFLVRAKNTLNNALCGIGFEFNYFFFGLFVSFIVYWLRIASKSSKQRDVQKQIEIHVTRSLQFMQYID